MWYMVQKILSSNISNIRDGAAKYVFSLCLSGTWPRRLCPATLVISGMCLSSKSLHSIYVVHGSEASIQHISDIRDEAVKLVFTLYLRGTWFRRFYPATLVISRMRLSSKSLYSIYVVHGPQDSA